MISVRGNLPWRYPFSCLLQKQPRIYVKYLVRIRESIERCRRCCRVCYVSMLDLKHEDHLHLTLTSHIFVLQPIPDQDLAVEDRSIRNAVNTVACRAPNRITMLPLPSGSTTVLVHGNE